MNHRDIATFQVDCARKAEQIRFLQSIRPGADDRLAAWAENYVKGWTLYTDPARYHERQSVAQGRNAWQVNQEIMFIMRNC